MQCLVWTFLMNHPCDRGWAYLNISQRKAFFIHIVNGDIVNFMTQVAYSQKISKSSDTTSTKETKDEPKSISIGIAETKLESQYSTKEGNATVANKLYPAFANLRTSEEEQSHRSVANNKRTNFLFADVELGKNAQFHHTKDLLNESEKFVYIGAVSLISGKMCTYLANLSFLSGYQE